MVDLVTYTAIALTGGIFGFVVGTTLIRREGTLYDFQLAEIHRRDIESMKLLELILNYYKHLRGWADLLHEESKRVLDELPRD